MKSALIYDWLLDMGGGERVLQTVQQYFDAPIYTLFHRKQLVENLWEKPVEIHSSFFQNVPLIKTLYRNLLPLYPYAIEQFDLRGYDLVLSISHSFAQGVLTNPEQVHINYCFTPMRHAWDLYHETLAQIPHGIRKMVFKMFLHRFRQWNLLSASRVDHFIAISHAIARRIQKVLRRDASVIYPPVDVERFFLSPRKEEYYIALSRLVPYKRIDLVVDAFSQMRERKLLIIGKGPLLKQLKKKATQNISFLGFQSEEDVASYLSKAKALIFPSFEDFGLVPIEAQASGTPVIALGKGGALETIIDGKTGLFFEEPTIKDLIEAVDRFEKMEEQFDPHFIQKHASSFSKERFLREFSEEVKRLCESHYTSRGKRFTPLASI